MKILVADDDQLSRSLMRKMLLQSGYDVVTAKDGAEAVAIMLDEAGPRMALLDWMMPEVDGPGVCQAIRAGSRRAYIYMVLLTSRDSKDDLVAGLEAGADDYLTKPCHTEELRARLRTGMRILNLEDSLVDAREEMRFRATHDALTQLLDRGAILQDLSVALKQAIARQEHTSLILCDVDHFKKINDTYGHPVGDEVLREVARRLEASVRSDDSVGRYGGEEFLLLLKGCAAPNLEIRAQRICETIRSKAFETAAGPLTVTMSAGALCVPPSLATRSANDLMDMVDSLLYRAKRQGRDRATVERFGQDQPSSVVAQHAEHSSVAA